MSDARSHDEWLFGGLAAGCAAVMTQMVDRPTDLGTWLGGGVLCFAVALPLLVASLVLIRAAPLTGPRSLFRLIFDLAGSLVAIVGFVCLFFHVNAFAGGAFLASCSVAFVLFLVLSRGR